MIMVRCAKKDLADFNPGAPFKIEELERFSVRNNALVIIDNYAYIEDGIFIEEPYGGKHRCFN